MRGAALLIVGAAAAVFAQDLAPEVLLAAHIRQHLNEQLGHLPDYTCLETLVRYHREQGPKTKLLPLDRLSLEVLFSGSKEFYGWPGARTLDEEDPAKFIGGGMIGNGLFALFQDDVANPSTTYRYRGEEALGERKAAKYDFHLSRMASGQHVMLISGSGTVGIQGTFWADPRSLDLLRVEAHADDIPPYLPLADMSAAIDYAHTRIGAGDVLLAQTADLHVMEQSGEENYDHVEFTHCSQFHAQSELRFEAAEATPAAGRGAAARSELEQVPALLLVRVILETPLAAGDAVGKPLEGRVSGDVRYKGAVAIPDGSRVHGRLRRLEEGTIRPGYFVVGIEFTEVEVRGAARRFYADLLKADPRGGVLQAFSREILRPFYPGSDRAQETIHLPELPGVAAFFVPKSPALPREFWTEWRTRGVLHR